MDVRRHADGTGRIPTVKRRASRNASRVVHGIAMLALLAGSAAHAGAEPLPYDSGADARADLARALGQAARDAKPVLVVFGANWCEDCRSFDRALHRPATARLVASSFHVVKVDVGRFDRNLDIAADYGNPVAKGIPAAVLLSPAHEVRHATRAGELADARRMGEGAIHRFLEDLAAKGRGQR